MALTTTNINTAIIKAAIGETSNSLYALRTSTKNNWWGFSTSYVTADQWGVPPISNFGYRMGDYRGYDHTYAAYTLFDVYNSTPSSNYYEDGMVITFETGKLLSYMADTTVSVTYKIEAASSNTIHTIWTDMGYTTSLNGANCSANIMMSMISGLVPHGTIYFRISLISATAGRFDLKASVITDGYYIFSTLTPYALTPALVNFYSLSLSSFKAPGATHSSVRAVATVKRLYGRDDSTAYSWSFTGTIRRNSDNYGSSAIASNGSGTVVGQNVVSPSLYGETVINDPYLSVGTLASVNLTLSVTNLPNSNGNISGTVIISDLPEEN